MQEPQHRTATTLAIGVVLGGLAAYVLWRALSRWTRGERLFQHYVGALTLSVEQLRTLRDVFVSEARLGLEGKKSSLLMMPSMVDVLPTGEERGEYLAIDIGGTNFRVVYAELGEQKGQVARLEMQDGAIPVECFTGHVDRVFDVLAGAALAFLEKLGRGGRGGAVPPCGFCFSFPVQQTGRDAGRTLRKTKSFDCEGFVGADPAQGLRAAFRRRGHEVAVPVLLNDAVGTLAGGHYTDPAVLVGLILGTGTNASYVEQTARVATIPLGAAVRGEVVVNTEWGDFRTPHLPRLQVDLELDAATPNVGGQQLEKLLSGLYLGEIARRVLRHLAVDGDASPSLSRTAEILEQKLGLTPQHCDLYARQRVQRVCHLVAKRSAALAACCLAGLLELLDRDGRRRPMRPVTVAVDGGVFEHYKPYRGYLAASLDDVLGADTASQVTLRQVRDASSLGTAFLAAAAAALPQESRS